MIGRGSRGHKPAPAAAAGRRNSAFSQPPQRLEERQNRASIPVMTEMEDAMGRPPSGQAMTSAERQRRYVERQAAKLAAATSPVEPRSVELPPVNFPGWATAAGETPMLKLDHIRLDPRRTAAWLAQRLGRDAAIRFRDELNRAIGKAPVIEEGEETP
jgi:hypothetical protein